MNIFISYSGKLSRDIASIVKEFIPMVIQSVSVFAAAQEQDIKPGTLWQTELDRVIQQSEYAIICITQENLTSPWLMYGLGAMSAKTKIIPLLIDLDYSDIKGPLLYYQSVLLGKKGLYTVIDLINDESSNRLNRDILSKTFELIWPMFDERISNILRNSNTREKSSFNTEEE